MDRDLHGESETSDITRSSLAQIIKDWVNDKEYSTFWWMWYKKKVDKVECEWKQKCSWVQPNKHIEEQLK